MNEFEKKLNDGINKTGFVLEYNICKLLEKFKWTIISNRYYIDDSKNIEREIDIVAYKTFSKKNIHFYTCLIISCKKAEENVWTFLTKKFDKKNPNINYLPLINWTNVKALKYKLTKVNETEFNKTILKIDDINFLYSLDKQVFAFQEMNKKSGKPLDDKNIYNSIITTIKASEYEKNSLNKRKKTASFYNFNLISIFEGEMIEIFFYNGEYKISSIDNIKYLNRHIINNNEEFYRVHFVTFDGFENLLKKYNSLCEWNFSFYFDLYENYFIDVFDDSDAVKIFWNDFNKEILWITNFTLKTIYKKLRGIDIDSEIKLIDYEFDKKEQILNLNLILKSPFSYYVEDDLNEKLNKDDYLTERIRKSLIKWYRYEGNFKFTEPEIPF